MSLQFYLIRSFLYYAVSVVLAGAMLSGCSVKAPEGSGPPAAPLNPSVAATFPDCLVLDEFVPLNASIEITFDREMREKSICASNIYLTTLRTNPTTGEEYAARVPCLPPVTVNGVVTIKPLSLMEDGRAYSLTVTTSVYSRDGANLAEALKWDFIARDIGRLRVRQGGNVLKNTDHDHNLGSMFMNASTEKATIELENYGTRNISISSIAVEGLEASHFILTGTGITTIGPESSESFTVHFLPTATGKKAATVRVTYTDGTTAPGTGDFTFTVSGNSLPMPDFMVGYLSDPADTGTFVALLPAVGEYDFGSIVLGNSGQTLTMAIKNNRSSGGAPVTINSVTAGNSDFILNTTGMLTSIPAEGITTFTAKYTPSAVDTGETTTLTVSSPDVEEGSYPVDLAGICRAPEIEVSGTVDYISGDTFSFDDLATYCAGMAGQSITLSIKNSGSGDLILAGAPVITGDNADEFTISSGPGSGTHIASGSTSTVTIDFVPGSGGAKTAALEIASDDYDEPVYIINLAATVKALDSISISAVGSTVTEVELGNSVQLKATGDYEGTLLNVTQYVSWSLSGDGGANLTTDASSATIDTNDRGDITASISMGGKSDSYTFNCYETGSIRFNFNSQAEVDAYYNWTFVNGSGSGGSRGWFWGDENGWAGERSIGCGRYDNPGQNYQESRDSDGAYFTIPYDFTDVSGVAVEVRVKSTTTLWAYPFLKIYISKDGGASYFEEILNQPHSDTLWHTWKKSAGGLSGEANCVIKVLYDHYLDGVGSNSIALWMDWLEISGTGKFRH